MPCDVCPCPAAGFDSCPWESGTHRHPHAHICGAIRDGSAAWVEGTLRAAARDRGDDAWRAGGLSGGDPGAWRPVPAGSIRSAIVSSGFLFGGAERWMADLIRETDGDGIGWAGIGVTYGEGWVDRRAVAGFRPGVPVVAGLAASRWLARNVDVLFLWAVDANRELEPLESLPAATVLVGHGSADYTRRSTARASAATVLAAVHEVCLPAFPEDQRGRVRVVHNPVDGVDLADGERAALRRGVRASWGLGESAPVLGYLGRSSSEKRPEAFLDAVAALPEPWRGVMVGPHQDAIRDEAGRRGLAGRITFAGPTTETAAALCGFDVLIVPSADEGFGYSALEGIERGVPVVMTPVGFATTHPQLVTPIGFDDDGPAMAAAVQRAVADASPARLAAIRDGARAAFSRSRFRDGWRAIIEEAAGRKAVAPGTAQADWHAHVAATRDARAADLALVQGLTDEQGRAIDGCRHRYKVDACCGSYNACRAHGGRKVQTVDCARCVVAGGPP